MQKNDRTAQVRQSNARLCRQWSLEDFHAVLKDAGVTRAYLVYENGVFRLSHPSLLQPLQAFFELSQDFSSHEGVFIGREEGIESLFFAFVHDTRRGLAQGGLRFTRYPNLAELLVDGLRLSQGMTRKNALAGLHWGGGKGIMTLPSRFSHPREFASGSERQACFEAYGRFVASLGGVYYTAEDVGTNTPDMTALLSQNRFTTCIPPDRGGSGNPSPFTARGVLRAMQAAWLSISGSDDLRDVRIAVQGTGNVGAPLIRSLDDLGAEVLIADVNSVSLNEILSERPHLQVIDPPELIFDVDADIFAPCAIGAQVNIDTIPRLKVKLVCGAANNILREPEADAERLRQRNIGFVPDFICNRMGIVNCADEWQGYLAEDVQLAAERVFPDTLRVFNYANSRHCTPTQAAHDLADMAACELHPLLGHRGRRLIDYLVSSNWADSKPKFKKNTQFEPAFVATLDEPPLRLLWERERFYSGKFPVLAATPINTASAPDLAGIFSSVLLDIKSRYLYKQKQLSPRRVLGTEHGGLALQLAVERNSPYTREELGRDEFFSLCRDHYFRNEALVREQMQQTGVGFEPALWQSPMRDSGRATVDALFDFFQRADLIYEQECIAYHSPASTSVLVASDLRRGQHRVRSRYFLKIQTQKGEQAEVAFYFPEYLPGIVALGVHAEGPYADWAGQEIAHPLYGQKIPVIATLELQSDIEWIIPLARKYHERLAREHQLYPQVQIFEADGHVCAPGYEHLSLQEAREKILQQIQNQVRTEEGQWYVDALYCSRSGVSVIPRYSTQVFVKIEDAVRILYRSIEEDEVTFSTPLWKERILKILARLSVWCISRQYWWGNPINNSENVFSTWFSMAAWALQGVGWPENPKPEPIDEVFVDSEWLFRWIVPTLLVGVIVSGRPLFKHIYVHGTLHVMERSLTPRSDVDSSQVDEERFLHGQVKRPMKYRLGNVVEPVTLIRRFGADALRLGYVLALASHAPEVAMLSEDRLKLARKTLHELNTKVSGFFQLATKMEGTDAPLQLEDHQLLKQAKDFASEAMNAYEHNDFLKVGQVLVSAIHALTNFINGAVASRRGPELANLIPLVAEVVELYDRAFSPLCPFIFNKLSQWVSQRAMI
jgi:valyl-tRNA synthetase/glutamate dehydrogenase/leucine dehydrogenase